MSFAPDLTSRLLRHQRWIVGAGILLLVELTWAFVLGGAGMQEAGAMAGMAPPPLGGLVLMW